MKYTGLSKIISTKISKFITILIILANFLSFYNYAYYAKAASISSLQQQQSAAAAAAAAAKAAAAQKAQEAAAIQAQINEINKQINESQAALSETNRQIEETQALIGDLSTKISEEEEHLKQEQGKQDKIIAAWYMEGDSSSLINNLVGSSSLSEAINKDEYYDSISQQIKLSIEKINALRAELTAKKMEAESKKVELVSLQKEQEAYNNVILSRKNQQNRLLNATVAQKKSYLDEVSELQKEINRLSDEIYAERQRLARNSSEIYISGSSGYPFTSIDEPDPWLFLTRECTSYAAWYWNVILGKRWVNTRPGSGSAWNWPALASDQGYSVSSTPVVGAIISWQKTGSMPYGHVAIVEKVNANGTIDLSEYNWVKYSYSYRANVTPGYYGSYSYIH